MSKATPLPWRIGNDINGVTYNPDHIMRVGTTKSIAQVYGIAMHCTLDKQSEHAAEGLANAELIVRAVNNHESLLAALKEAKAWMPGTGRGRTPLDRGATCSTLGDAVELVESAIAKATRSNA